MATSETLQQSALASALRSLVDVSRRGYLPYLACCVALALATAATLRWVRDVQGQARADQVIAEALGEKVEADSKEPHPGYVSLLTKLKVVKDTGNHTSEGRALLASPPSDSASPARLAVCEDGENLCYGTEKVLPWFAYEGADPGSPLWERLEEAASRAQHYEGVFSKRWAAGASPIQASYLSVDGLLRVWPKPYQFSEYRDYRGKNYVEKLMGGAEHDVSRPYVDDAGAGLVETWCFPDHEGSRFYGVLCLAYALKLSDQLDKINAEYRGAIQLEVHGQSRPVSEPPKDALVRLVPEACLDTAAKGALCVENASNGDVFVAAPVGDAKTAVLAIRKRSVPPSFYVMFVSLVLAAAFAGTVVASRRRQFALEEEGAVLRKLQVGVVREREGRIIEANDRAEELLGYALPPIGLGRRDSEVTEHERGEDQLFEDTVLVPLEGGRRLEPKSRRQVDEQRAAGLTSHYYAKKRSPGVGLPKREWVEVRGSPLGSSSGPREQFAILDVPSETREGELLGRWQWLPKGKA